MRPATVQQCAVLAGGLATRLGALAAATPKPLLPVGGRPFLAWLLRELSRFGVDEVVLLTGHLADRVEARVHDLAAELPRPLRVTLSREPARAGTGGALFHARAHLQDRFLLCNGDSILDANLAALLAAAARDPPETIGRMLLRRLADASRYGVAECRGERITAFRERPPAGALPGAPGTINAGIYLFDRRILDEVTAVCSLERDVLPGLAARGALRGSVTDGWFIDIGIPEDLARAGAELPARLRRPALFFFPRDGAAWSTGAREMARRATEAGWHVFAVGAPHALLAEDIRSTGGTIDDARHGGALGEREKSAPEMIGDLIRAWELDPARCVMLGGQAADRAAAAAAGIAGPLVPGGDPASIVAPPVSETVRHATR